MSLDNKGINILITGEDAISRRFAANVVAEALEDTGFNEVRLVNATDERVDREEVPTLLDLIQDSRPDLFQAPVEIKTKGAPGEIEDIPVDVSEEELSPGDEALADIMADSDNA